MRQALSPQATRNLIRSGSKRAEALESLTQQVAELQNTLQVLILCMSCPSKLFATNCCPVCSAHGRFSQMHAQHLMQNVICMGHAACMASPSALPICCNRTHTTCCCICHQVQQTAVPMATHMSVVVSWTGFCWCRAREDRRRSARLECGRWKRS